MQTNAKQSFNGMEYPNIRFFCEHSNLFAHRIMVVLVLLLTHAECITHTQNVEARLNNHLKEEKSGSL